MLSQYTTHDLLQCVYINRPSAEMINLILPYQLIPGFAKLPETKYKSSGNLNFSDSIEHNNKSTTCGTQTLACRETIILQCT